MRCPNCDRKGVNGGADSWACPVCGAYGGTPGFSLAGIRHDEGKPRWDLIPPDAMLEVVKVFSEGAKKYEDRNWEKGMKWNKHFAAMQRHLWKWESGISLDEESGLNHLAHAAFGCLALLAYELRQIGEDDRPKLRSEDEKA
jgi:hypothetical protein